MSSTDILETPTSSPHWETENIHLVCDHCRGSRAALEAGVNIKAFCGEVTMTAVDFTYLLFYPQTELYCTLCLLALEIEATCAYCHCAIRLVIQ